MPANDNRVTDTSRMNFEPDSWQEGLYELYVGFHVGTAHIVYFMKHIFMANVGNPLMKELGMEVQATEVKPRVSEGDRELKVIGVGYGRTGTVS